MAKQLSGEIEVGTKAKTEVEAGVEAEVGTKVGRVVERFEAVVEAKFTKEQLLSSKKYIGSKDILTALLTEGESYTHAEVSKLTEDFMKGEIK
ncbi:MAG: hypothetical protein AB7E42_08745 [Anaerotignaceae bacterium]